MGTFVHLIADYGRSDPAFSEVVHRLKAADADVQVQTTEVEPLSTVATGFWIEQLALHNPAFDDLLVYSNTAPRTEDASPHRAGTGGKLCHLTLENGVPVVAVDAGYNLSFVRDRIGDIREVETPSDGSQFRSRDHFPARVSKLANGNVDSLGRTRPVEGVPSKPESVVCHVDGYGNVKTSIRESEFDRTSTRVAVEIGTETAEATVSDAVSEIEEGAVGIVPGSAGGDDPYMELFLRGGSAAAEFGRPDPGEEIVLG